MKIGIFLLFVFTINTTIVVAQIEKRAFIVDTVKIKGFVLFDFVKQATFVIPQEQISDTTEVFSSRRKLNRFLKRTNPIQFINPSDVEFNLRHQIYCNHPNKSDVWNTKLSFLIDEQPTKKYYYFAIEDDFYVVLYCKNCIRPSDIGKKLRSYHLRLPQTAKYPKKMLFEYAYLLKSCD